MYAGLRRSSYGPGKNRNGDEWWIDRAKAFAGSLADGRRTVRPAIVEIVSVYLDDGTCQAEFARPAGFRADAPGIAFAPSRRVDHERALAAYDRAGVRALVQMETGSADVETCLELMHAAFGGHPCVIGYGLDAEWFFCRGSKDKAGRPITDAEAERWMRRLAALDPGRGLFLKHFDPRRLPPTYRHPKLWFVDDSQDVRSAAELQKEFEAWGRRFAPSAAGFQFGYPKDSRWWKSLPSPPRDIARPLLERIPNARFVFWVDFTAADTTF